MSDATDQADALLDAATNLNHSIHQHLNSLTLADARHLVSTCREIEGWLAGIRDLLDVRSPEDR